MRLELTKRADYALRAVVALATADPTGRLSVREIAAGHGIPERFLTQVMADLVGAGIAEGRIGRSGGYRLTRPPGELTVLEVIEAIEGDSRRRRCVLRGGPCQLDGTCAVHEVFARAQARLIDVLGAATIAELPITRSAGPPRGPDPGVPEPSSLATPAGAAR